MTDDAIQIREFREEDLDTVVAFSLRAWEPVFDSLREVLGDEIFFRLHPDWRSNQAEAVKSSCLSEQRDVFVAVADGKPVGFAAAALNAFHEGMRTMPFPSADPKLPRMLPPSPALLVIWCSLFRGLEVALASKTRQVRINHQSA